MAVGALGSAVLAGVGVIIAAVALRSASDAAGAAADAANSTAQLVAIERKRREAEMRAGSAVSWRCEWYDNTQRGSIVLRIAT